MKHNIIPDQDKKITALKGILDQNKEFIPVATHNGPFHADELVALSIMFTMWKEKGLSLLPVRTRDEAVLDYVLGRGGWTVDVGKKYDPRRQMLDHHFVPAPVRDDGLPYAAAGLTLQTLLPGEQGERLEQLVRNVDSADNGIKVEGWEFSQMVHKCNPLSGEARDYDARFEMVLAAITNEVVEPLLNGKLTLERCLADFEMVVAPYLEEYDLELDDSASRIREAFTLGSSPVLELDRYEPSMAEVCPEAPGDYLFTIFPHITDGWMVQQIPAAPGAFGGRKKLPEAWAGKDGAELDAVTGIKGCVFVHPGRFIGKHSTKNGAKAMALLAAQS